MEMRDIPWNRLVHFHGRATDIPAAIRDLSTDRHREAEQMLARNLEHQDGIIQATPLAVHFMVRALREGRVRDRAAVEAILRTILDAAEFQLENRSGGEVAARLEDVFARQKLWPEFQSDEDDEALWEEWSPEDDEWVAWAVLTQHAIRELGMDGSVEAQRSSSPAKRKSWWRFW